MAKFSTKYAAKACGTKWKHFKYGDSFEEQSLEHPHTVK